MKVTKIGVDAFKGCSSLTSVTIGNSVESIGDYAFNRCSSLTSITIPNSVTSIGWSAFKNCTSLEDLKFEDGIKTLSLLDYDEEYIHERFEYCPLKTLYLGRDISWPRMSYELRPFSHHALTLTTVIIGDSVTSIREHAFDGCSNLTSVTIGNSVKSIGDYAFKDCSSLTSVIIGNSVESIGSCAFKDCSSLTSITIPNSVTSIGDFAFYMCSSLTSVIIGNSVTNIGQSAFTNCDALTELVIAATEPPTVSSSNFNNSDYINMVVKVPEGSLEAYQAADVWKYFWDIQEYDPTGIEKNTLDEENTNTPIYNLQGVQMMDAKENLPTGIYIQGGKKIMVR